MRFSRRSVHGRVTHILHPEDGDDLWTLYNLLSPGDLLRAPCARKVSREEGGSGERVHAQLTLRVTALSYDAEAPELRVSGVNTGESAVCRVGAHHTAALGPRCGALELEKDPAGGGWDGEHERTLASAAGARVGADVAAILLDGGGHAAICLVTERRTLVRARVDVAIPRKRGGASAAGGGGGGGGGGAADSGARSRATARFFEAVLAAALRVIDWAAVRVVIVASPGFAKDEWLRWAAEAAAARPEARPLAEARAKLLPAHVSAAHPRALAAAFAEPALAARLAGTRAAGEAAALASLWEALRADDGRAHIGYRLVRLAADRGAIARLLVADALLRRAPPDVRRDYVALAAEAAAAGGEVTVCSAMHAAGAQLSQMGGVAAVCRYAIADAEEASLVHAARALAHARTVGAAAHEAAEAAAAAAREAGGGGGGEAGGAAGGGEAARAAEEDGAGESDDSSDSDGSAFYGVGGQSRGS